MTRDEVMEELERKLTDAKTADGFFITVTVLKGEKLDHYQCQTNFKKDDVKISLLKLAEMVGLKLSSVDHGDIIKGIRNRTWN